MIHVSLFFSSPLERCHFTNYVYMWIAVVIFLFLSFLSLIAFDLLFCISDTIIHVASSTHGGMAEKALEF